MAALLERGAQTSARGCLERDADHILKTDLFFHAFVDHVPARGRVLVRAFVDLVLVSELNRIRGAEILLRFASVLEESGYYALSAEVIGRCIEEPGIFAGPCLLARVQRRDRALLGLLEEAIEVEGHVEFYIPLAEQLDLPGQFEYRRHYVSKLDGSFLRSRMTLISLLEGVPTGLVDPGLATHFFSILDRDDLELEVRAQLENRLGRWHWAEGRMDLARSLFEAALTHQPDDDAMMYDLLDFLGQDWIARQDLLHWSHPDCKEPLSPVSGRALARLFLSGRRTEAIACLERDAEALDWMGGFFDELLDHLPLMPSVVQAFVDLVRSTQLPPELTWRMLQGFSSVLRQLGEQRASRSIMFSCLADLHLLASGCLEPLVMEGSPQLRGLLEQSAVCEGHPDILVRLAAHFDPPDTLVLRRRYFLLFDTPSDLEQMAMVSLLDGLSGEDLDSVLVARLSELLRTPTLGTAALGRFEHLLGQWYRLHGDIDKALSLLVSSVLHAPGDFSSLFDLFSLASQRPPVERWTEEPLSAFLQVPRRVDDPELVPAIEMLAFHHPPHGARLALTCLEAHPKHFGCLRELFLLARQHGPLSLLQRAERHVREKLEHDETLFELLLGLGEVELAVELTAGPAFAAAPVGSKAAMLRRLAQAQRDARRPLDRSRLVPGATSKTVMADAGTEPPPPNILFVTVDALNYRHLGHAGYQRQTTPALDRFARQAVVFERAYSPAPATLPAGVVFITGRYLQVISSPDMGNLLDQSYTTMAEYLRAAGYRTVSIVGNHFFGRGTGFEQGFDAVHDQDLGARRMVSLALKNLVQAEHGRPLFLWMHLFDPHAPYTPPFGNTLDTRYYPPWIPATGRGRPAEHAGPPMLPLAPTDLPFLSFGSYDGVHDSLRWYFDRYDEEILSTDRALAPLLDWVLASRNTILVFSADHGESMGEHNFWFGHGNCLYNEELRVPLLFFDPEDPTPRRILRPVGTIDILPTLLQRLALPSEGLEGKPLLDLGPRVVPLKAKMWINGVYSAMLVKDGYKYLLHQADQQLREELFVLGDDPYERHNLARQRPHVTASLRALLKEEITHYERADLNPVEAAQVFPEDRLEMLRQLGYVQ